MKILGETQKNLFYPKFRLFLEKCQIREKPAESASNLNGRKINGRIRNE